MEKATGAVFDSEVGAEGQEIEQDAAGRITASRLSSERARELAALGRQRKADLLEAHRGDLADALIDLLIDSEDAKAESLELLVRELAATASAGNASQRVRSLEILLALIGASPKREGPRPPKPSENCVLCNRGPQPLARIDGGVAVSLHSQIAAQALKAAGLVSADDLTQTIHLIENCCNLETPSRS